MAVSAWHVLFCLVLCLRQDTLGQLNLTQMDEVLAAPTRDLPRLSLWLRESKQHQDEANPYVQWFLHRSNLSLEVQTYEEHEDWLEDPFGRDNHALVVSLDLILSNQGAAGPTEKAAMFFYILEDQTRDLTLDEQAMLEDSCRKLWMLHKIYNRFVLARDSIWIYDPFQHRDASFGQLIRYDGEEPLNKLLFHDMQGYPLRIQMFRSVYTRPEMDPDTGLLVRVTGVDFLVAQMLQERLNFTMLLQQPDKNYFG